MSSERSSVADLTAASSSNGGFYENGTTNTRAAMVEWVEIVEPQTQQRMYANLVTGQCAWNPPSGANVKLTHDNQWWELFDSKTGRYYYYNAASSCTKWQRPAGPDADIIPLAKLQTLKDNSEGASPRVRRNCETHTQTSPSVRRLQNAALNGGVLAQNIGPESGVVSFRSNSRASQSTMNGMQSSFEWMSLDEDGVLSERSDYGGGGAQSASQFAAFPTGTMASATSTISHAPSADSLPTNHTSRSASPPIHKRNFFSGSSSSKKNSSGWSKDAPKSALTQPDNRQLKREMLALFKTIQSFMGDRKTKTSSEQLALNFCELATKKPENGDEAVALLIQQLSDNEKPDSLKKGWELLTILLAFVQPTEAIAQKLTDFLDKNSDSLLDPSGVAASYFAQQCMKRLNNKTMPRTKPTMAAVQETRVYIFRPPLFSASLEELMEMQQERFPSLKLPWVLTTLIELLYQSGGRMVEGIFRVGGDMEQMAMARGQLDGWLTPRMHDANVPAGLIKQWLRQLPVPLIPPSLYDRALSVAENPSEAVRIVDLLPEIYRLVLVRVIALLQDLAREEVVAHTKMDASNLAMVMAPNILRCESDDPMVMFENARREMGFLKTLVANYDTTFIQGIS